MELPSRRWDNCKKHILWLWYKAQFYFCLHVHFLSLSLSLWQQAREIFHLAVDCTKLRAGDTRAWQELIHSSLPVKCLKDCIRCVCSQKHVHSSAPVTSQGLATWGMAIQHVFPPYEKIMNAWFACSLSSNTPAMSCSLAIVIGKGCKANKIMPNVLMHVIGVSVFIFQCKQREGGNI